MTTSVTKIGIFRLKYALTIYSFSLILFLLCNSVRAGTQQEIQHLLSYVAETECKYERNGAFHTGAEAAAHIRKKHDYYREDIKTTEDFIRLSATESRMSQKKYQVHCENSVAVYSSDWLFEELLRFRALDG